MRRVGLVGWRGMVGSVLLARMQEEGDFAHLEPVFFSTSAAGGPGPMGEPLQDAWALEALGRLPILVSCQGGDYTRAVYPRLRAQGWKGIWIDAASTLRMAPDACIVLDPVNRPIIDAAIRGGIRTFAGSNCTVGLLLMGVAGLLRAGEVEWISCMTYQAASGAGAAQMRELVAQWRQLVGAAAPLLDDPGASALALDRAVIAAQRAPGLPTESLGFPLAASLLPWVDRAVGEGQLVGQSREEWKSHVEANKMMDLRPEVPIDGLCVRVGSMRCHAQGVTLKLRRPIPPAEVEGLLAQSTPWTRVIPNNPDDSLARLTPTAVSGSLEVPIGRVRPLRMGPEYLSAFTVGDQLLWGAAEPLRRTLHILAEHGL